MFHQAKVFIKFLVYIFLSSTPNAMAFIEPAPWVIEEMARRILLQKIPEHNWQGMIRTDGKKEAVFATFSLTDEGMKQKSVKDKEGEQVNLYFLDSFWRCRVEGSANCTQSLLSYLKKAHIDLNTISLGFFDNEPAYIIGARSGDLAAPQLWISKNTFYPVKEKRQGNEYTWDKWTWVQNDNFAYPRLINFKTGKKLTTISMN